MQKLPGNYNFEIEKIVETIRKGGYRRVALQFPEGLLMYSLVISDILVETCPVETLVMGDVTYGACCVDDYTARLVECDLLVHFGHSCLVPISTTLIKTLYVFVDISFDLEHLVETIRLNIAPGTRIGMVGTIQFVNSLQHVIPLLEEYEITVPQSRPLSRGELLGCTAPKCRDIDCLVYLGDGRFHLEAIMIANPSMLAYRYDPYSKVFSREEYEHGEMQALRNDAIASARNARTGTLGRQGSLSVYDWIIEKLKERGIPYTLVLLSEITPEKLSKFTDVDVWIQTSCPRLSIDWGYSFPKPLLTPYEAAVWLGEAQHWDELGTYPMDYYANDSLGKWTPNHKMHPIGSARRKRMAAEKCQGECKQE